MTRELDPRITPEHLTREAFVYARQSSQQQVRANRESARVQLGLREKAIALGWRQPAVVDDDLGVSAGGFAERSGFQRMLASVAVRRVGIILCADASRLSRNSKDWAHLFELCGYFGTLIADLEQIYDLARPNDRLVLGVKGTVSEMELQILRTRLRAAAENKAARGELGFSLPCGYVSDPSGKIVLDPDVRVQAAVRALFDQLERATSVRQLALSYRDEGRLFPVKKNKKTVWQVPAIRTLRNLLAHPIYAGTYAYGRRMSRVDYIDGKLVKRQVARSADSWKVCLHDHHPAYITWERFLANQAKITQNRPRWSMDDNQGAIREGLALLVGLLRCALCGGRVQVSYKHDSALYYCDGGQEKGSKRCLSFGSKLIDQHVGRELCRALEPLSVEAAVAAAAARDADRAQAHESARLQLQAARYEADRAFEQYDLADPRNRLVVDTLEQRLDEKLAAVAKAERELAALADAREQLTEDQRALLRQLADEFPAAWNHPRADPAFKKRLLRAAIREVLVGADSQTIGPAKTEHWLEVTIHWQGGAHTRQRIKKRATPKGRGSPTDPELVELVRELAATGLGDADVARILNMQKITSARGLPWTQDRVDNFRGWHRISIAAPPPPGTILTQAEVATFLGISRNGVLALERLGAISKNQVTDFAPWRVPREQVESERVKRMIRGLEATGRLSSEERPENQATLFDQVQFADGSEAPASRPDHE